MISMAAVEMTAVLGTCIISDNLIKRQSSRKSGTFSPLQPVLRGRCTNFFEEGLRLLDILAQRSPLAFKGASIMRQLQLRILHEEKIDEQNSLSAIPPDSPQTTHCVAQPASYFSPPGFPGELWSAATPESLPGQDFTTAGWESFSTGADMSWFFEDIIFQNAGVGDPGMDFGVGFGDFGGGYDGI
jgi:hypothetical protein